MSDLSALLGAMQSTGKSFEVAPCLVRDSARRAIAECPSVASAAGVSITVHDNYDWTVRGTAWPWEHRIKVRYTSSGTHMFRATEADIIGVTLHELAHIACYQEDLEFDDSSYDFGIKCKRLFAEWNALGGVQVDETKYGAYRGVLGRENKRKMAARTKRVLPPIESVTMVDMATGERTVHHFDKGN